MGWDKQPLPAEPPRQHQNDDDGGDDGDSVFSMPTPLRS
jgi:hypothetical protein